MKVTVRLSSPTSATNYNCYLSSRWLTWRSLLILKILVLRNKIFDQSMELPPPVFVGLVGGIEERGVLFFKSFFS